jgi:hypothetical protein
MAMKEDIKIIKSILPAVGIGTLVVAGIALVGRFMSGRK